MTDEEKKAIETIKDFKNLKWYEHAFDNGTEVLDEEQKQDIDTILNLIKKQSKEIEELKKENKEIRDWKYVIDNPIDLKKLSELDIIKIFGKSYIAKDIIKAKIEELDKKYEDSKDENGESPYFYPDFTIRILQSLLEKE